MSIEFAQIDAFTDRAFSGNPAAVCLLDTYPKPMEMQSLAGEMNLSETAFLKRVEGEYELRWFTPTVEVDLCGHATLASAHYLWSEGNEDEGRELSFRTRSGLLKAKRKRSWIEMDFPSQLARKTEPATGLIDALGAKPRFIGRSESDWLVELATEGEVRGLQPELTRLAAVGARGVICTSISESQDYDFVSRFFGPAVGVAEDPVTGSAHCCLGPFWAAKLGRSELVGYQASARGGTVRVRLQGDRVILGGQAVTVMRGRLTVPWPASV
jgi:PhzF family phenazine biosynthesis protein